MTRQGIDVILIGHFRLSLSFWGAERRQNLIRHDSGQVLRLRSGLFKDREFDRTARMTESGKACMYKNKTLIVIFIGILVIAIVLGISFFSEKTETQIIPQSNSQENDNADVSIVTQNLEIPWEIVFLPDSRMLVTERPGRVRIISRDGNLNTSPVATISEVKHIGEGGLLGIAIHPEFAGNQYVYLYYTYSNTGNNTLNKVVRFKFENDQLINDKVIVDSIPGAANHNGGRIKFGPDNFLYITTGDAQEPSQAQDINSLAGKILRVTDEGKTASGNPFDNLVYSYGHRNPQGLAWDKDGRLWATEHGRSGIQSGLDEINLVEPGKNYGWPEIQGNERKEGMETPQLNSGSDTWAPSGAVFIGGSLFFSGLRGQTLYEAVIAGDDISFKEHFKGEFGRIRNVVLGSDGYLYITTSNRDGRGTVKTGDDKIIKINQP